jgi:hypothetical protein
MRGAAENNKMLRAQELEDLRPKFELTQKDKDKNRRTCQERQGRRRKTERK